MMPTEPDTVHWPTVFVTINVLLPVALATAGPILPVVRMGRGS